VIHQQYDDADNDDDDDDDDDEMCSHQSPGV
jgi:hypothetical protein